MTRRRFVENERTSEPLAQVLDADKELVLGTYGLSPDREKEYSEAEHVVIVSTEFGDFEARNRVEVGRTIFYYKLPWGGIVEKTSLFEPGSDEDIAKKGIQNIVKAIKSYIHNDGLYL